MKKNLGKKRLNSKEKSSIDHQISEAPCVQQLISEAEQFLDAAEVAELKKKHFERSPEPVFEKDEITIIAIHTFCLNQNTFEPSDSCLLTTYSVERLDTITPIQFEGELDMLNAFWSYLGEDLPIFFVGHNALTFDMPSLMKRFLHYQPNFNFSSYINQRFTDIPFFIFQQLSKCEEVFNIFDTHSVASKFYNCGGRNSLEILVTQLLRLNYNQVIIESSHDQQLILQCCHENSMTSELFRYFLHPKIQHLLELNHYKIIKCGLENFVHPTKLKMEIETINISLAEILFVTKFENCEKAIEVKFTEEVVRAAIWVTAMFEKQFERFSSEDGVPDFQKIVSFKTRRAETLSLRSEMANVFHLNIFPNLPNAGTRPKYERSSRILEYSITEIFTSYMNNIQTHFPDHFNRWLNIALRTKEFIDAPETHPAKKMEFTIFEESIKQISIDLLSYDALIHVFRLIHSFVSKPLAIQHLKDTDTITEIQDDELLRSKSATKWSCLISLLSMSQEKRIDLWKELSFPKYIQQLVEFVLNGEEVTAELWTRFSKFVTDEAKHFIKHELMTRFKSIKCLAFENELLDDTIYPFEFDTINSMLSMLDFPKQHALAELKSKWQKYISRSYILMCDISKISNACIASAIIEKKKFRCPCSYITYSLKEQS
ncbi:hypothetical protein GEMRC1_011584 [Eukaryota sp. GEM-RC1]